ncbi:MAG TPA: hypothetical protein VLL51_08520 [Gemmatimonadales bacterium]|nr:hypothetical protein [Gemmatimonadales bacterium]
MKLVVSLAALGAVAAVAVTGESPAPARQQVQTEVVSVRCPAGNVPASVSPEEVRVRVGNSVEWRVIGPTASDSIWIDLKAPQQQAWPFAGAPPRGGSSARANGARNPGTYSYNVHLLCRVPGGGIEPVTIDPDIIVEE